MTTPPRTPAQIREDVWILRNQILPNIYGLKYAALVRVLDDLDALLASNAAELPQEPTK